LYGVHRGADIAVDDAVFGFIVFFVCAEHWVIPHPVANREIIIHNPPVLSFHDLFFFLTRVGVDNDSVFRIGFVSVPMCALLFAVLIDDHAPA
jgi:hypothetical protein